MKKIKGLKETKAYSDGDIWFELFDVASEESAKRNKTIRIILPLLKQPDIVELLAELHDLRKYKKKNDRQQKETEGLRRMVDVK